MSSQSQPRLFFNVDLIIEHGERLIKDTITQVGELYHTQKPENETKQYHEQFQLLLSMLTFELTVYGNVVATLAHCQAQPKSCPRTLNFRTLHEKLQQMAYYEQRIWEEFAIVKAVLAHHYSSYSTKNNLNQEKLLNEALALEKQTRKVVAGKDFITQPALKLDITYALYFLREWITRAGQYKTADYAQRGQQEVQAFERHRQSIKRLVERIERL